MAEYILLIIKWSREGMKRDTHWGLLSFNKWIIKIPDELVDEEHPLKF